MRSRALGRKGARTGSDDVTRTRPRPRTRSRGSTSAGFNGLAALTLALTGLLALARLEAWWAGADRDLAVLAGAAVAGSASAVWLRRRRSARAVPAPPARLIEELHAFTPSTRHAREAPYQFELAGWLRAKGLRGTRVEEQRGRSRPDLVLGDWAIEVKGPTTRRDLQSIPDKCMRYQEHYHGPIVVLCDVRVNDAFLKEWTRALRRAFPSADVIRVEHP